MNQAQSFGSAILHVMDAFQKLILVFSTIIILVLLATSIIFRYLLHINMYGLEELVQMAGFYLYFIGAGYSVRLGYEIKADMVDLFSISQRKKDAIHFVANSLATILAFLFVYWGSSMVQWGFEVNPTTPGFHLPILISYIGVETGFVFCFIYTLINTVKSGASIMKSGRGCA